MLKITASEDCEVIESSIAAPVESHLGKVLKVPVPVTVPVFPPVTFIVTLPIPSDGVSSILLPANILFTPEEVPPGSEETFICLVKFSSSESVIIIKSSLTAVNFTG